MNRIIESKCYNIKEATLIWHYDKRFLKEKGDISWTVIDLYRTTSGRYFIHGSGGPGSDYANRELISSTWGDGFILKDGEEIISMSPHEVIAWGEENLPCDVLRKIIRDIKQQARKQNTKVPEILKSSEQRLALRTKAQKAILAFNTQKESEQLRQEKIYEPYEKIHSMENVLS
jgi:hypothetical protein